MIGLLAGSPSNEQPGLRWGLVDTKKEIRHDTHARLIERARGEDRSLASVIRRALDRELRSAHHDEQEEAHP